MGLAYTLLCIYVRVVQLDLLGIQTVEAGFVSNALFGFQDLISRTGFPFPALTQEVFIFTET